MGLFEDDENVRRVKKVKAHSETKPKRSKEKKTLATKILAKVESKQNLVEAASGSGSVKFEDVDVSPASRKNAKKVDKGIIEPLINYVSDENEIQQG